MELDDVTQAMVFHTSINHRMSSIAFAYLATQQKISELLNSYCPLDDTGFMEAKSEMKEIGVTAFKFSEFIHENSIMALAKAIEDTSIELKREKKFKFDSVKNHHDVIYLKELQMIRALANVIKHNVSKLNRNTSESARFLVDECALADGWDFATFIHTRHDAFDIVEYIPKVYVALLSLVDKVCATKHRWTEVDYDKSFNEVYEHLLPDSIAIERPNKAIKSDA